MNSPVFFELQVDDLHRAMDFYQSIFGWSFTRQPNPMTEYWRIQTSGISGGLLKRPAAAPPKRSGTNAATVSMEVHDFAAAAELILSHGGIETMPKFPIPGLCWQGYFIDPDGNTFGIFESDPNAQ